MISALKSFYLNRLRINPSRIRLDRFLQEAAQNAPPNGRVLDAGAGEGFYRQHFNHTRYDATDLGAVDKTYGQISYISNLSALPVAAEQYDLIVCTQVLEHVPNPQEVLCELYRCLKPNGQIWLSAPFFFEEHEIPYDYFRYTRYGMRHLVETAGFQVKRLEELEGYFGSFAYQLEIAVRSLPADWHKWGKNIFVGCAPAIFMLILKPILLGLSFIFTRLELKRKYSERGICKNYALVAEKKTSKMDAAKNNAALQQA